VSGRMCVSSGCQLQASRDCASYVSWNNGFSGVCVFLYNGIIMIPILAVVIFKCVHAYHYVEHSKNSAFCPQNAFISGQTAIRSLYSFIQ
jgi:hypothetical protein